MRAGKITGLSGTTLGILLSGFITDRSVFSILSLISRRQGNYRVVKYMAVLEYF